MPNRKDFFGVVGYVDKGEWNANTNYLKMHVVRYQGSSYSSLLDDEIGNQGYIPPDNPDKWELMAQKGDTGLQGPKGDTPVKGTDYFTTAEINQFTTTITNNVNANIGLAIDNINGEEV